MRRGPSVGGRVGGRRPLFAWGDEPGLVGEYDGLCAVVQVELLEDAGDVGLDSRVAEHELARDLGVRDSAREHPTA
jgi:hypothetical protein